MKIGVYFSEKDPRSGGGFTFETSVMDALLERLNALEHRFVFLGPSGEVAARLASRGHEVVDIPTTGLRRAIVKMPRVRDAVARGVKPVLTRTPFRTNLDELVASTGVDLLWCLGPDVPSMEIPYVMTVWDLQHRLQPYFPEVSANGLWSGRERYYSSALRRATLIVCGTEAGRDEIERFYGIPRERIVLAPHPAPAFDTDAPDDGTVLATYGLQPGYLFYPAQFWPHKNHATLIEALGILSEQRGVELDLVLSGSDWGDNRPYVAGLAAERGIAGRVKMLGFVERSHLPALYRNALALTYVSHFGPENLPPLEAFSFGCPVIAADVPGAREQFGDAVLLVDPRSAESIASAVLEVREEATRERLVDAGTARVGAFTTADFVERILTSIDRFEPVRRCWPPGAPG